MSSPLLYVGTHGAICAVECSTGKTAWKFKFKSSGLTNSSFVTLLVEGPNLYAHANGEVHCIDAKTGVLIWTNPLSGMGYQIASLATDTQASSVEAVVQEIARRASQHDST